MRNYFNYFTEIEERFQKRRGSILLLSTLDWALIETWREAGVPLDAVLRGIDSAFDKYEQRLKKGRMRRINGLAWCTQAVMEAAEELREASTGTASSTAAASSSGFEAGRVAMHLEAAASALDKSSIAAEACRATGSRLRELAAEARHEPANSGGAEEGPSVSKPAADLESLERVLTVLEESYSRRSLPPRRKSYCLRSRSTRRASSLPTAAAWARCNCAKSSVNLYRNNCSRITICRASASSI